MVTKYGFSDRLGLINYDNDSEEPNSEIKGVVQISHGMSEHKERYYDFMEYLKNQGYIVVINDHRGHGSSVKNKEDLGYFYTEDINYIINDLYDVTKYIKNKYKDKTDERSKMQMAQEMQNIYQKYDIHPFGSMLITFIQLPIMMGMYYATMRSVSVVSGSFMGISLAGTPLDGFKAFDIAYISIYVLMVIFYIVSMKLPQWLKKWQDKKDNVKVKKYAQEETNPMANSMNMSMYFMTAMICIMYISWPMAMSFYWLVSSVIRVCQSLILHKVMNKK